MKTRTKKLQKLWKATLIAFKLRGKRLKISGTCVPIPWKTLLGLLLREVWEWIKISIQND